MTNSALFRVVSAFVVGLIFSFGLIVSQMIDPLKVLNFLDIFGNWDPSLALVLISAIIVTLIGYKLVLSRQTPIFEDLFRVPGSSEIDLKLLVGAALFGIGWGLIGLCPGPALAGIGLVIPQIFLFVVAVIIGINAYRIVLNWGQKL
ncbi:MAG: YeeE/YedE family protein [Acidimicrobiales bacterium]|nr:YeeE/YedE family protein [Hyphomonadaceae bacterium]RZV43268.1 MAG: YeeE/YedE family protein [Acidimicrobiales bacterium]